MKRSTAITGRKLNKEWGVNASHALYSQDGKHYRRLERFPGALFDYNGYVLFKDEDEYRKCEQLSVGERVEVAGSGISAIPGYLRKRAGDRQIAQNVK